MSNIKRDKIGSVAVDSGLLMILDPCRFKSNPKIYEYEKIIHEIKAKSSVEIVASDRTSGWGVVFSTMQGDGIFDIYRVMDLETGEVKVELVLVPKR
jgi:hypothetical protein